MEEKQNQEHIQLEQGTYEIIRDRLGKYGADLKKRIEQLNGARKEVFGGIETSLVATEHISTEHSCEARDMIAVGSHILFGYNVHLGLKNETEITDVFSIYEYGDRKFRQADISYISDPVFTEDFKNLYKYYRSSRFAQFVKKDVYLYFIFQVGKELTDIKVFKWQVNPDDTLTYVDSRSEHEVQWPDQFQFRWKRPTRDHFREGKHPHISIEDKIFVETIKGDLTIKIEDNTATGKGIYAEPVDHKDQSLGDADIVYAIVGEIIVLRFLPYQERKYRYIVYNHKTKEALRIDALEQACVLLPDDHGIIFPQGYYLQSGEHKIFDYPYQGMGFERMLQSPNGEDFLYVFYNKQEGAYTLLLYNIIEQKLNQPIHCNGYTIFENGELCMFRAEGEPKKNHAIQIWQTSFVDADRLPASQKESFLYKIGNKEVVRAMAECRLVVRMIEREDTYATLYIDLSKSVRNLLDAYHWLSSGEAFSLTEPLGQIESAARSAIAEYDKVMRLKKNAGEVIVQLHEKMEKLQSAIKAAKYNSIDHYVKTLTDLRALRGEIISARELRYMDMERLKQMEDLIVSSQAEFSSSCITFLLTDDALLPYEDKVNEIENNVSAVAKVVDADGLDKRIIEVSAELEMLIDVVNSLNIEDSTVTTRIIDSITNLFSRFNKISSDLRKARKKLFGAEAEQEFASQLKLIHQGAANYINISDTPEKCDEYLNRLVIQLEELEGKFADFAEFTLPLTEAREEIHNIFEAHKLSLIEARNNRSAAIYRSCERILEGVKNRLDHLKTADEINAYMASDMLVQKVQDNITKLRELDDSVKADELTGRVKALREEALRQLRDKNDLFTEGENTIRLGNHLFSVNTKKLDVTLVLKDDAMYFHLTGTNFFEKVVHADFLETRKFWDQPLVSENAEVYRAEYLAYLMYHALKHGGLVMDEQKYTIADVQVMSHEEKTVFVHRYMAPRYEERYVKGVHDQDAALILAELIRTHVTADLLIYSPDVRAFARFFWMFMLNDEERLALNSRLKACGLIMAAFKDARIPEDVLADLRQLITEKAGHLSSFHLDELDNISNYLFHEISRGDVFVVSPEARDLKKVFTRWLKAEGWDKKMNDSLKAIEHHPHQQFQITKEWIRTFIASFDHQTFLPYVSETAVSVLIHQPSQEQPVEANTHAALTGFTGEHARVKDGNYAFDFSAFISRLHFYHYKIVPEYRRYQELKHELMESFKTGIRLKEFQPQIMSSFVRNKLIDEVYLPLIGNNLAKQIGVAGKDKRTDLMGMLLLISPPGYGKTTLMEYVAHRLGLIFMKINGPALGHGVTSVDPLSAPNSAAREELNKLNLAFEMGDNVMIYIDDIQHCNPEFLQKFISLCDAQRKIEGVYKGVSKTYDLRGRKIVVVMAGNPYTESGAKFRIPDMLANRSDIYNLGDVIGGKQEVFELSYVENCLTSNTILSRLNNKSMRDVYELIRVAKDGTTEGMKLESNHTPDELEDYVNLLKRVIAVRDIVFRVNKEYILSASQEDEYRTSPSFKLQGSYRDMNKIVEKLVPVMNDDELQTVILTHYENEAQTLTTAAEASLLRFHELYGVMTGDEKQRWESIKETYVRNQKMKGVGKDQEMALMLSHMESISNALQNIGKGFQK